MLADPGIDPKRVGVLGHGLGGTRALWLMALDERIACGVAVNGLTRLGDWQVAPPFGRLGREFTLLEWDMMVGQMEKHLLPQGPTPLGHAPEPEPVVDDRFLDPAEQGLAGWVAEMSQRPSTWTWALASGPFVPSFDWGHINDPRCKRLAVQRSLTFSPGCLIY